MDPSRSSRAWWSVRDSLSVTRCFSPRPSAWRSFVSALKQSSGSPPQWEEAEHLTLHDRTRCLEMLTLAFLLWPQTPFYRDPHLAMLLIVVLLATLSGCVKCASGRKWARPGTREWAVGDGQEGEPQPSRHRTAATAPN